MTRDSFTSGQTSAGGRPYIEDGGESWICPCNHRILLDTRPFLSGGV